MPAYLTIKHKEAVEACEKMKISFDNLKTQIEITHNDGFKPLNTQLDDNQPLIDDSHSEFSDIDTKSTTLNAKSKDTLQAAKDMNNVPSS